MAAVRLQCRSQIEVGALREEDELVDREREAPVEVESDRRAGSDREQKAEARDAILDR